MDSRDFHLYLFLYLAAAPPLLRPSMKDSVCRPKISGILISAQGNPPASD
jgi:hypothetical protein